MTEEIRCEGVPRALGLDQGRQCASAIRDALASRGLPVRPRVFPTPRRLSGGATLGAGVGREVVRHFPHLVERTSGIARAARVPVESLMEEVVASAYPGGEHALAAPSSAVAARGANGEIAIARALDSSVPWILRTSRPEVGFRSVEVTLPWVAGSVAGVNEAGIAALVVASPAGSIDSAAIAPPAWLLVQDCLHRFASLDTSLEWCLRRPSGGNFSLLLGDASGDCAVIEVSAAGRALRHRGVGHAVIGGQPSAEAALRKRIAQDESAGPAWFADESVSGTTASQVWLHPDSASLDWASSGEDSSATRVSANA